MTVELDKDVHDFLTNRMNGGGDVGKTVNDLIRLFRDQQELSLEHTPELEAWLLESMGKPTSPLTSADFEAMEKRVLARHKAKHK